MAKNSASDSFSASSTLPSSAAAAASWADAAGAATADSTNVAQPNIDESLQLMVIEVYYLERNRASGNMSKFRLPGGGIYGRCTRAASPPAAVSR